MLEGHHQLDALDGAESELLQRRLPVNLSVPDKPLDDPDDAGTRRSLHAGRGRTQLEPSLELTSLQLLGALSPRKSLIWPYTAASDFLMILEPGIDCAEHIGGLGPGCQDQNGVHPLLPL